MSAIAGLASIIAGSRMDASTKTELRRRLNLPEPITENLQTYLHNYLRSIKYAGYEKKRIRKLMILGNVGEKITIMLQIYCFISYNGQPKINLSIFCKFYSFWKDKFICFA